MFGDAHELVADFQQVSNRLSHNTKSGVDLSQILNIQECDGALVQAQANILIGLFCVVSILLVLDQNAVLFLTVVARDGLLDEAVATWVLGEVDLVGVDDRVVRDQLV